MSDDDGWEARMAARAAARGHGGVEAQLQRWAEKDDQLEQQLARQTQERMDRITLGEAIEMARNVARYGPIGCACVGRPSCCRYSAEQARRLSRAAHIVVKLLAEEAKRRAA